MVAIELDDLTVNNIGMLEKINQVVLPTKYSEEFYKKALESGEFVKLGEYINIIDPFLVN